MGTVLEVKDIHKSLGGRKIIKVVFSPNQGTRTTLLEKVRPYFFGTYYDLFAHSTGSFTEMVLNPRATTYLFVIACFAWIIVCYGIAHVIFTRRDVL